MNLGRILLLLPVWLVACATTEKNEMNVPHSTDYFPHGDAAQTLTVTNAGPAFATVVILTEAVAIKETSPHETIRHFGEVYAFVPSFFAVHHNEPTLIRFWNLQADDEHDFMLLDPHKNVLMKIMLLPLQETAYVFTFHEEGLFPFICAMHRPAMNGQVLVLPPTSPE